MRFWLTFLVVAGLLTGVAEGQYLSSSRGMGLGAYTALVNDLSGLDWNPAGLMQVRDWELSGSNMFSSGTRGLSFQTLGVTKRFLENHTFSLRYSPGLVMEFIVPSTFQFQNGQKITFDKRINYKESYAFGYGFQMTPDVALGFSGRLREEFIADTRPFIEQDTVARLRVVEYNASSWNLDIGMLWNPDPSFSMGVVAKNLFRMKENTFPQEVDSYALRSVKSLRMGLSYSPSRFATLAIDFDTERQGGFGSEWHIADGVTIRQGSVFGAQYSPFVAAISGGLGFSYESVRFDLSYLHFFNPTDRSKVTVQDFVSKGVNDIAFNQFTQSQGMLTINVPLGRTREYIARIEYVTISSEVYPSSYHVHAIRPIGKARVRNISQKPIQARVSFFVDQYMDRPTETPAHFIAPNEEVEIPFTAIFNDAIRFVPSMVLRAAEVLVKASTAEGYDDRSQTRLIIRGRNDWDGDALTLRSFVTPEDPDILRFTRTVVNQHKDTLAATSLQLDRYNTASFLFNEFASRLSYVNDPRGSKDRVQYPSETFALRGGDCDDMTVAYASLLSSVGISTAFIDVIPPGRTQDAHIFLMFDTGVPVSQADIVSNNPKRYVVRKNERGEETIWLPIETTIMTDGFQKAWEVGAREYFDHVEVGLGVVRGWVRVVDVRPMM
ncbi:MAG: conjugal transfer protein TraF [Bacteroidota bacterium]